MRKRALRLEKHLLNSTLTMTKPYVSASFFGFATLIWGFILFFWLCFWSRILLFSPWSYKSKPNWPWTWSSLPTSVLESWNYMHTTMPSAREDCSFFFFNGEGEGYRDGPISKCLPCKHKDLSSVPRTHLKKQAWSGYCLSNSGSCLRRQGNFWAFSRQDLTM